MSALSDVRAALRDLLTDAEVLDGVTVFSELPEKVTPPFVAIGPGDPYVEFEGAPFGWRRVHLLATFVTDRGTNDVRATELDDALVEIIAVIEEDGSFMVTRVDQPGQLSIGGQSHLGVSVNVLTEVQF